jgi:hypothetical protein
VRTCDQLDAALGVMRHGGRGGGVFKMKQWVRWRKDRVRGAAGVRAMRAEGELRVAKCARGVGASVLGGWVGGLEAGPLRLRG